ncbi:MAG: hypothetical protein DWB56_10525 [Candidatus Jettenia sp.]|uniref:Carbohydrate-binding domain-containing protein n=1 Tax=Candidatus Jettenia caeni TaxID=247490 RepID=I3IGD0_9BACT|nr:sugar-binding protein [Candidatus Jettenia sp. AMX1]MBC6929380.1 hypothetical protein [Candidatus Jettenia sp.]WKZ14997.1 MAG: sugar-binding protein [Candidatus Jettenia caeni]KAA0249124.1 MAG: hypothetical protein EDM77_10005 [Candidatus Jettenia sp. AMX1]MCE7881889.1 hypothetical protein [Candidatus Jettenia sp. AMX1]MCQ3927039.1 hypothetical protein [Candidatus Jettenia sp.]
MKFTISLLGFAFLLFSQIFSLSENAYANADIKGYKNFYGIAWCGKPEEDIKYAKQMGYDYIAIHPSSALKDYQNNPDCSGLKFYLIDPCWYPQVLSGYSRYIDTTKPISEKARDFYNQRMVWKSNDPFPSNLATGYHPSGASTKFSVLWDFQQQAVIDEVVEEIIRTAKMYEDPNLPFTFGGYIIDEPKLAGGFYRLNEKGDNEPVPLSYWTGMDSGLVHGAITHDYATYTEGVAAFYKKLRTRMAEEFKNSKWIVRPTWLYNEVDNNEWIYQIKDRADKDALIPDMLTQGSQQNANFVDDGNNFNSGIPITHDKVGNSQIGDFSEDKNRLFAAKAAINGAWYNWFGQFSSTKDTSDLQSITEVSPKLKLIRCLPNWDNLNNVPLTDRSWNGAMYQSTKSYASSDVIYSRHPKTGNLFAVFLTTNGAIKLGTDEKVTSVYRTDDFFIESEDGTADVSITGSEIRLKNRNTVNKGYIFTVISNTDEPVAAIGQGTDVVANGTPTTHELSSAAEYNTTVRESLDNGESVGENTEDPYYANLSAEQLKLSPTEWQQVPIRTAAQKAAGLMGGEGTQLIYTIAYAQSNPNMVYLTSDTSQIWKSEDGGTTWKMKKKGFPAKGGISLVVSPTNDKVVFVAGSVHTVNRSTKSPCSGIYRTIDGGETWKQVKQTHYHKPSADEKGGSHFAFGASSSIVYAGTHDQGLLKSKDGGSTWSSMNVFKSQEILDVKAHPTNPSTLYVSAKSSSSKGLYRVTDNGSVTVQKIGSGLPTYPHTVVINPKQPLVIYAALRQYGVYMSVDGGNNFSPRNSGISVLGNGKKASYLSISQADPNCLYVSFYASQSVYYTHNGGSKWYSPNSMDEKNAYGYVSGSMVDPASPSYIGFLAAPTAFHPNNKNVALIAGNSYHIKRTTDGGVNWRFVSSGYTGAAVAKGSNSMSWDPHNPNRFAFFLTDYGPYLTEDGGSTFRTLDVPKYGDKSTPVGALDPARDSKVIVTAAGEWYSQVIVISRDNGKTWTQIKKDSNGNSTESSYRFIAFHPQNTKIIYAGQFKSTDKGYTWKKLSKKIVAMYQKDGNIVYSASNNNGTNVVYRSTDGGNTWSAPYGTFKGSNGAGIYELAVDPTNPNRLYAAVDASGLFVWNGSKWIEKTSADGLKNDWFGRKPTQTVAVDPKSPNVVYIGRAAPSYGQSNGVFRSTDYGATWQSVSHNIGPDINISSLSVNPNNGYVYAGSYHGTFKLAPPYSSAKDVTPPVASITVPTSTDTHTTDQNTISLSGTASDNISVTSITWVNNRGGSGTAEGTTNWSIPKIALFNGENIITITAKDQADNKGVDAVKVNFVAPNTTFAHKALSSPTIDGNLKESLWNITTNVNKVLTGTPDNEVNFGVSWDNKNLYVGVKVLDTTLRNDSGDPWQDDSIEIYIDANHNQKTTYDTYDRQYIKGYNDSALFSRQNKTGVLHAWTPVSGGYSVEMAIPWSNLGITPSDGMRIGFDIQNNDDDNGNTREHVLMWNGKNDNYRDTSAFGDLILSSEVSEPII